MHSIKLIYNTELCRACEKAYRFNTRKSCNTLSESRWANYANRLTRTTMHEQYDEESVTALLTEITDAMNLDAANFKKKIKQMLGFLTFLKFLNGTNWTMSLYCHYQASIDTTYVVSITIKHRYNICSR